MSTQPAISNFSNPAIFSIYIVALFVMPLPFGSNRDWAWPFITVVFCLLVLILIAMPETRRLLIRSMSSRISVLAFLLLTLWMTYQLFGIPYVASPISIDHFSTYKDLLKTVTYGCLFVATIGFADSRTKVSIILYTIVLAGILQALIGIYSILLGYTLNARGTFPSYNHFAGYLEMALSLGVGLMIAMQTSTNNPGHARWIGFIDTITGPKGRLRLVLVIMVTGLVMSTSRMGNIAFLSSILITAFLSISITRRVNKTTAIFLISILIIDVAIIGNYFGFERISRRIQHIAVDATARAEINQYSWRIFGDHPWVGTGAGTYEYIFPQYRQQEVAARVTNAENDYFEFLVELGIIGTLPLIMIVCLGISMQIRLLRNRESQFVRGIAFGCLMGTVSLLIHSAADFNLQIPSNAALFVLLLALPQAMGERLNEF
ncbi:MAG: O-antigen ligase family protein [Gammaproteobacteria bacterium]|nr:O-antigen ligase family protein [Gammaproteobacteria bacterium]